MEIHSFLASHFRTHYKKLLLLGTASLTVYLIKKYMDKRKQSKEMRKGKKKIKDFPTIEEIQKFIEDLPFEAVKTDKTLTLKDLLGELSEFSEDEDWKELIASVHTMYEDNVIKLPEETGSIMSIYEDPNVITLHGTSLSKEATTDRTLCDNECYNEATNLSKGIGDVNITICKSKNHEQKEKVNDFEMLLKSSGDGDKTEIEKTEDSSLVF